MSRPRSFRTAGALLLAVAGVVGCSSNSSSSSMPLFEGMGQHARATSTSDELAQRYFDQGLVWTYAFNHDEAIRSFEAALEEDPDLPMAWWGIALCNGPHINNPAMSDEQQIAAAAAIAEAQRLRDRAAPVDRALIDALAERYASAPVGPEQRTAYDQAYAEAMRRVWAAYHDDPDVGCLTAEALMDLQPWDLWTAEGEPKGVAEEVVAVLERTLELDPMHPGANHLYIHAVEASPTPERAIAAADRLRDAVPAAGHLLHMPAHIDVRVGAWDKASIANERAIAADAAYREITPAPIGFWALYMAHNDHFLAWTSMMEGREAAALAAARRMLASVPEDWARANTFFADPFFPIEMEVRTRFGRWSELLAMDPPPDFLPISTALWHFHRGVAHANLGEIAAAREEQATFRRLVDALPDDAMMMINPASDVLQIADHKLEGEIALHEGDLDRSIEQLRAGVEIEDRLLYMEPPDWMQPMRHPLGAVLLKAGRAEEAQRVYESDLEAWPRNGWALLGLGQALRAQGRTGQAAVATAEFERAWRRADTKIVSSCPCVQEF